VPAPAPGDVGEGCADIGSARACWGKFAVHGVISVERTLPVGRAAVRGFRCTGAGDGRVCEDRAWGSDAFVCTETACTQRHPRMPDDGEWECAEIEGAVICRGGEPAAGVVPGPPDPGFVCGTRRQLPRQRICVDFSPDRPKLPAMNDCRFQYEPGAPLRLCRAGKEPALGRACKTGECPAGTVCVSERCLPLAPEPSCWVDKDCPGGVCLLGSCRGAAP
jgi:hypothetical protein